MFRGFWGLKIIPGKTYSQTVDAPFRVSNAALAATINDPASRTSVLVTVDDKSFVLCSLVPGSIEQQTLDVSLTEGEEITFETQGENEVHLTGNFIDDSEDEFSEDDDSDSEDNEDIDLSQCSPEELQELIKMGMVDPSALMGGSDSEDEDYDSDDADTDGRIREITDEEEAELVEEAVEEKAPSAKEVKIKKQAEKRKAQEEAQEAAAAANAAKKAKQAEKKEAVEKAKAEKKAKAEAEKKAKAEAEKKKGGKRLELSGGLIAEIQKEGEGAGAKNGQRVGMYYIGKLTNGKVFDQNTKGKPFWFRLGAGEVIRGWDKGILGMKRGGERRLTIPAAMAYGKRGAPPDIPGNATLVFDIRLVDFK
ncbi:peptidylprolyl isomerase fpr3 [Coemansia sp. Benny D115]|nr:peptidylprolyl isomerase fpr3 [Coemansia sp. Benny D115]